MDEADEMEWCAGRKGREATEVPENTEALLDTVAGFVGLGVMRNDAPDRLRDAKQNRMSEQSAHLKLPRVLNPLANLKMADSVQL